MSKQSKKTFEEPVYEKREIKKGLGAPDPSTLPKLEDIQAQVDANPDLYEVGWKPVMFIDDIYNKQIGDAATTDQHLSLTVNAGGSGDLEERDKIYGSAETDLEREHTFRNEVLVPYLKKKLVKTPIEVPPVNQFDEVINEAKEKGVDEKFAGMSVLDIWRMMTAQAREEAAKRDAELVGMESDPWVANKTHDPEGPTNVWKEKNDIELKSSGSTSAPSPTPGPQNPPAGPPSGGGQPGGVPGGGL